MGIRTYDKDHLKELLTPLVAVPNPPASTENQSDDEFRFWTLHPKSPALVDLNVFNDGQQQNPLGRGGTWSGPFSGRPNLIAQLAPAIKAISEYASSKTVIQTFQSLRAWWRLFDAVEVANEDRANFALPRVESVSDITELHRQVAFDRGMSQTNFSQFIRLVNLVRKGKRLPQFYWDAPEKKDPKRHLPPQWQIKEIRFALKKGWFEALGRWKKADQLLNDCLPVNEAEINLLKNYQRFKATVERTGLARPPAAELWNELAHHQFNYRGFSLPTMLKGFYPDPTDIRIAFHLCLANTGWNPSVLLSLDANERNIEPHPKDPSRYLLTGKKGRGNSIQISDGLFKSKSSAGVILQTLLERTAPLRIQLRSDLQRLRNEYRSLQAQGAPKKSLDLKRKEILKYEQGERSPWLYVTAKTKGIEWLDDRNYFKGLKRDGAEAGFILEVVAQINQRQPADKQLAPLKASDFRDAFAAYAYQVSGGMVLYVMRALGHKSPDTTQNYLNNTLLNEESGRLYRTFSNSLWHEIKVHGRVDPTVIAKWSRDGEVSAEERTRLHDYRALRRSRIGVGCKDPTNPPKHIAPRFKADGKSMCPVQRCTLCLEHAVIFPDSLSGLCKRLAELRFIQSQMSAAAFVESAFGEESENTGLALENFDAHEVAKLLADWEKRIVDGTHRVIDFEGIQEVRPWH